MALVGSIFNAILGYYITEIAGIIHVWSRQSVVNIRDNAITNLDVKMNREINSNFLGLLSLHKTWKWKYFFFSYKILHYVHIGVFR